MGIGDVQGDDEMTDFHPATTAIETIIGPHLTRDCARELAESIVENLLHSGWLQPADLTMPAIVAQEASVSASSKPSGARFVTEFSFSELQRAVARQPDFLVVSQFEISQA